MKNKQKDVKVQITANTEEEWLKNEYESRSCLYLHYGLFCYLVASDFQTQLQLILIYQRIFTVCKCGLQ